MTGLEPRQDRSTLYEERPLELLIEHSEFDKAESVFEFGCGTGRLAERLLSDHLPSQATYTGVDISETMIGLTNERVSPWSSQAKTHLTTGMMTVEAEDSSYDRFISTYVCDLLSTGDIVKLFEEAHHVLRPDGLLCLASLTAARRDRCQTRDRHLASCIPAKPHFDGWVQADQTVAVSLYQSLGDTISSCCLPGRIM